jgi:hypothetical protein
MIHGDEGRQTENVVSDDSNPYAGKLAYSQLSRSCRQVYEEIGQVIENRKTGANLSTTSEEDLCTAYQAFLSDNGGVFWVSGYSWKEHRKDGEVVSLTFYPTYAFSEEDQETYQGYVDEVTADYLAKISPDASDFEKARYVYEMLIYNVSYNESIQENQNILSVFLWGESVCSGFASAAQYMLGLLDVPSMIVYGESMGVNHAWNLVKLDGEYYYLDATWGNTASQKLNSCSYEYLGLNDRQLAATHKVDMYFDPPACEGSKDNYFVHEGLYIQEDAQDQLARILKNGYESGDKATSVMFSSQELLEKEKEELVMGDGLAACFPDENVPRVNVAENDELHILSIVWKTTSY